MVVLILTTVMVAGCSSNALDHSARTAVTSFDPELRAVRLQTTGCGFASGRSGSGVAIGGGLVVTVAHLVVRAASVEATVAGDEPGNAVVAAVDLRRDLAVLRIGQRETPDIETAVVEPGARGLIVGAAASGTIPFEVIQRVNLTIEEILGTDRYSRLGYELSALTADGDSGAGAYDEADNLIGIVFATGQDGETSWLTASAEIEDFVATVGSSDTYDLCD